MDIRDWDSDDYGYGEDYGGEWGDAEFLGLPGLPGLPGIPSPSAALARRLFPQRRRPTPSRPAPRPVRALPAPSPAAAVINRVKEVDDRQRTTATQLALLQRQGALQQSSEQFGPLVTSAAAALALGFTKKDMFGPALTHGLPLAQLLLASRGRAATSGFRANPWTTVGFPAAAILLGLFHDKIPGLGPTTVTLPQFTFASAGTETIVQVNNVSGVRFRFTLDGSEPGTSAKEMMGPLKLTARTMIKVRGFADDDKVLGPVATFEAP